MKDNNLSDKKNINQKIILVIAGLILALSYVGGLTYLKYKKELSRTVEADIITFKNLPKTSDIKATLKNKSGVYDLEFKNSALVLSQSAIDNFTVPYIIESRWQNSEGEYYDISWELDKDGIFYTITLDGFLPSDTISLSLEDSYSIKDAKMDWSGKIELITILSPSKNMDVCVDIKTISPFTFCHHVIGRKDKVTS